MRRDYLQPDQYRLTWRISTRYWPQSMVLPAAAWFCLGGERLSAMPVPHEWQAFLLTHPDELIRFVSRSAPQESST